MKVATVIQDSLRFLGGGELVCLNTSLALQKLGYQVRLVSDVFRPDEVETVFGMGEVIAKCECVKLPDLGRKLARFSSLPGLWLAHSSKRFLEKQDGDVVFVTREPRRPSVLPDGPLLRFVYEFEQLRPYWENYNYGLRSLYHALYRRELSQATFLALSPKLVSQLKQNGYRAAELVYPSYGIGFRPRAKKNQVVYVTFLAPQKQIDEFLEVARRLPQYKFYLVGRDTERINQIYHGYAKRVLAKKPSNVEYVEARIRQAPELLEESRVYLHTSTEPGMGIAVTEALSAGCIPVAPRQGGAGEVLEAAGVGFRYDRIEDAVDLIRFGFEEDARGPLRDTPRPSPQEIAERARIFSPEAFQNRIRDVIERKNLSI